MGVCIAYMNADDVTLLGLDGRLWDGLMLPEDRLNTVGYVHRLNAMFSIEILTGSTDKPDEIAEQQKMAEMMQMFMPLSEAIVARELNGLPAPDLRKALSLTIKTLSDTVDPEQLMPIPSEMMMLFLQFYQEQQQLGAAQEAEAQDDEKKEKEAESKSKQGASKK